jgi:predicted ABC-type sugar transport system permease subunit
MRLLGAERVTSVPVALLVWGAVCIGVSTLLNRTTFGKALYLIGNREAAAYLAGVGTRRVCGLRLHAMRARGGPVGRPARRLGDQGLSGWQIIICCQQSTRLLSRARIS